MQHFYLERKIDASRAVLWDVITNHELYGKAADNLREVEVVEGSGEGMKRICRNAKGESWRETCVRWEEGRVYSFEVDTSNYPYPLKKMQGTWGIKSDESSNIVYLKFDYQAKYGILGRWMMSLLAGEKRFRKVCNGILDRWEEEAESLLKTNG